MPTVTQQCQRCDLMAEEPRVFHHPDIQWEEANEVVVYDNVCLLCYTHLIHKQFSTLDVLRMENVRMIYDKELDHIR